MKREYPDHPVAAVAAVVFNNQKKLLLVRRGKEPGKGSWGIPGGAVELGESLENAVKREIQEETGIDVEPTDLITVVNRVFNDNEGRIQFHYIIVEYLCQSANTIPKASDDVDCAVWVSIEKAKTFPLPRITHEVIEKGWRLFQSGGEKS